MTKKFTLRLWKVSWVALFPTTSFVTLVLPRVDLAREYTNRGNHFDATCKTTKQFLRTYLLTTFSTANKFLCALGYLKARWFGYFTGQNNLFPSKWYIIIFFIYPLFLVEFARIHFVPWGGGRYSIGNYLTNNAYGKKWHSYVICLSIPIRHHNKLRN